MFVSSPGLLPLTRDARKANLSAPCRPRPLPFRVNSQSQGSQDPPQYLNSFDAVSKRARLLCPSSGGTAATDSAIQYAEFCTGDCDPSSGDCVRRRHDCVAIVV